MALIDNITNPECGNYIITNTTGVTQTLIIREFINNVNNVYEFEELQRVEILDTETFEYTIDKIQIQSFEYESDNTDIVIVINTCKIDLCILGYIDKLVCCNKCLDCDNSCDKVTWLAKYTATDTMYVILMDILSAHFGGTTMVYNYVSTMYDETHTLGEILDKLESLCSCNNC